MAELAKGWEKQSSGKKTEIINQLLRDIEMLENGQKSLYKENQNLVSKIEVWDKKRDELQHRIDVVRTLSSAAMSGGRDVTVEQMKAYADELYKPLDELREKVNAEREALLKDINDVK